MTHPAQHIYDGVDNVLAGMKLMSDRRPDAKIGSAASTFNSVLKEAKLQLPQSPLVQEMADLTDQDTVVAPVTNLSVLKAELSAVIYYPSSERPLSRPPYA